MPRAACAMARRCDSCRTAEELSVWLRRLQQHPQAVWGAPAVLPRGRRSCHQHHRLHEERPAVPDCRRVRPATCSHRTHCSRQSANVKALGDPQVSALRHSGLQVRPDRVLRPQLRHATGQAGAPCQRHGQCLHRCLLPGQTCARESALQPAQLLAWVCKRTPLAVRLSSLLLLP